MKKAFSRRLTKWMWLMSDLPELEDYYNNVDENNRLLRSKER